MSVGKELSPVQLPLMRMNNGWFYHENTAIWSDAVTLPRNRISVRIETIIVGLLIDMT